MEHESGPLDIRLTQARVRDLAEQLACEYAGAVAPGRVMRLVASTAHRLRRTGYRNDDLLNLTNATVRAELALLVGGAMSARRLAGIST